MVVFCAPPAEGMVIMPTPSRGGDQKTSVTEIVTQLPGSNQSRKYTMLPSLLVLSSSVIEMRTVPMTAGRASLDMPLGAHRIASPAS